MQTFLEACEQLVFGAPVGPFPQSQALYFAKYPLASRSGVSPFRVFIERYDHSLDGFGHWVMRPICFAIVHWQAEQIEIDAYALNLHEFWGLQPLDLHHYPKPWFRDSGAYARFYVPVAIDSRQGIHLITSAERPAAPEAPVDPAL